jgi:hypothetical protein
MRIKTILPFAVTLAIALGSSAYAAEQPKPANVEAQTSEEAKARAAYDVAEKTAREADAAVVPVRAAMQKADAEFAAASKVANTKRQRATDAKNLAGEQGEKELKQAEENVPVAIKGLTEATEAKPVLDKAVDDARAAVIPLQQAYDAAEKAAKDAEAAAKVAADAANKIVNEAKIATAQAATLRTAAEAAKNALTVAQRNESQATAEANTATQKLAEAEMEKKTADEVFANVKNLVPAATTAFQAAEKAALAAEAHAKIASAAEKQQAAADVVAKRKAADAAKAALIQAQQKEQQAQAQVQKVAGAPAQKKAADEALANAKKQVAAATGAYQAAEKAAQAAEASITWLAKIMVERVGRSEVDKQQAAAVAVAARKAFDTAKAALAQAQAAQQNPQNQANAAAKALTQAMTQKKAVDAALVEAKNQVATCTTALAAAEKAAEESAKVAEEKEEAAAQVAAKRKVVADAETAVAKSQQGEQQAQAQVNAAAKALADAAAKKKPADEALANAKKQVAAASGAYQAAEKAAQEAAAKAKQISTDAAKSAEVKKKAADEAVAKRKAADAAKATLAQSQQREQATSAPAAAAAKKVAEAESQKKAAEAALANAKSQVPPAMAASQAAKEAAKDLVQLDTAMKQAADEAAAKRKEVVAAKAALNPVQQKLEQATLKANAGVQTLNQAEARKKSVEEALENLKKRIAAAKESYQADEQAAKEAEAAAAPLKAEADKTRAAYTAAVKMADDQHALAQQAKAGLYRLIAARRVASLMESPDPPKPANRIDEIVFAKLKALGIQPVLCSDAVFVRRAYLDLTGKLPPAEEAKTFIQSTDPKKRVELVDRLLDRPAHVDYWAMKWGDILRVKAEFPVKVWPNAAQAYHRWVWESIAQNKPYDQFARELLTSSGSNFRVGPANFYRAIQDRTPEGIAGAVGLAMMGVRIHLWPADRRAGMAVFFSQVGYKPTNEWKEEVVFWDPLNSASLPDSIASGEDTVAKTVTATNRIPQALEKPLSPNGPLAAVFPDGTKTTIPPDRDPREVFADWLVRPENPWFTQAIVDRMWAWVMGRGIIHEADDIRKDNPPSNPELLAYLQKELIASNFDLKHLKRLIFSSTTYQFSSIPRFKGPEAKANFASYVLRRVEAEVLIDALNNITGSSDLYTSAVPEPFSYIPKDMSAVALADGSITSSFLTLFGRSSRSTGMEGERVNELASPQWLHMLNSATIQSKLQTGPRLKNMLAAGGKPNEIAERLYLTILSRFPTEADVKAVEEYAKMGATKGPDVWIDLAWALINSPEFLLRH